MTASREHHSFIDSFLLLRKNKLQSSLKLSVSLYKCEKLNGFHTPTLPYFYRLREGRVYKITHASGVRHAQIKDEILILPR